MASGNSSGLGSSIFRGALHGNSNNSGSGGSGSGGSGSGGGGNNNSGNTSGGSGGNTHHHSIHHHHHHHHHHHTTTHLQQGTVSGNHPHLHQQQPQPPQQQPPPPQPQPSTQPSVGPVWFTPTDVGCGQGSATSPDHMSTLMAKLWFDQNVESSLSALKREEHDKRLRDLRKELDYITDTDWKYSPVEKYIGKY
ncbi:hypothetical protein Pmani_022439 [Petrolisthes manimaculis]|uniref:Uncharacterized protein n=1 Tax=Petrolisthes manimaculis TaxID=1843537 RepID=A0AAE1U4D5_9EUCA|nr:hypothetical protein Pmani_022439 [Petrolisthes manimaculis]